MPAAFIAIAASNTYSPASHAIRELLEGKPLKGLWFDRTQEYAARNRGEDFDRLKYATEEILELSPLPCG